MTKDSVLLFTKDAFCTEYIPCYGNKYWAGKTPNIDDLVNKGTIYTRFYTAAPSSAMSYMAMFTGKYPYEQNIKTYTPLVKSYEGETLFDKARKMGYECHVIWDEIWMTTSYLHSLCYGNGTIFHSMKGLRQGVGFHYKHDGFLEPNVEEEEKVLIKIKNEIENLVSISQQKKIFLWFHLPHVIKGRVAYGSDIDLFDRILGIMRTFFDDSKIFVSGDHGNMNGHKGKLGYGFDVYEPSIRIPLITPRKNNLTRCDDILTNIDLDKIIFNSNEIPVRDYVISDSAYYAQPNRKLAVIYDKYVYIYNKINDSEELYDLVWDSNQNLNLFYDTLFDIDRGVTNISRELYFYPYWNDLPIIRQKLKTIKDQIWKSETSEQRLVYKLRRIIDKNKHVKSFIKYLLRINK